MNQNDIVLALVLALATPARAAANEVPAAPATPAPFAVPFEQMTEARVREIGPAAPGGRIVDVDSHPSRPWELWAAAASGGLWKSVNNGTTWSCVFDDALSIGDLAVAPSDPDVVWLGTGEGNNQRSSYAGNGVWITRDGGTTWTQVGLEETHHIGRVVVDPDDPDVAWVAALGRLYTPNEERGLYKTMDGGATWERVLHFGEEIGVADVVLDPGEPRTVYAATYERRRRAWDFQDAGRAAIYKTIDGGTSWRRLTGGLPEAPLGRIGLTIFPGDPQRLYACIDNQNLGPPPEPTQEGTAERKPIGGEIWFTADGGQSWEKRNEKPVRGEPPYYYGQIRVDPHDPDHVWLLGVILYVSKDGGRTFSAGEVADSLHVDHHALWFDPEHRGRILLGNDGGLAQSYDSGASWDYYDNLPIAQLYTVSVDSRRPYRVYGGLQDNGVWTGPSRSRSTSGAWGGEWRYVAGGDGMYVLADPDDPDTIYLESQFGALQRTSLHSQQSAGIRPKAAASPGEGAPQQPGLRFNWCSPFVISHHNSQVLYFGSQQLWRSLDRGDHWKAVSGDLTTADPEKLKGNVPHCTITTISESPLDPDLLLVGTDDGKVQWTDDGGNSWLDLTGRFPELPPCLWVSRVELSPHDVATAWVTFSGYREDDFTPWVYRTRDAGRTFARITNGLPEGPVNVVRESPRRANALYLGSDGGAFVSLDGGESWAPLASGLPTVSVLDLAIHPRERDVVLGTHGRGFYVIDVTPHEQLAPDVVAAPCHLFAPSEAVLWRNQFGLGSGWGGDRVWRGGNPPSGAALWYWLGEATADAPKIEVIDAKGKVVRTLEGKGDRGLQRVAWDLRFEAPKEEAKPGAVETPEQRAKRRFYSPGEVDEEDEELRAEFAQEAGRRRGRGGRGGRGELASPGLYTVRLRVGERTVERELRVLADPEFPPAE